MKPHLLPAPLFSRFRSRVPFLHTGKSRGGVLLCGYFGYGNTGDEAILAAALAALRREDPLRPVTVLSAAPAATASEYRVKAVHRFFPLAVTRELIRCDTLLFGGGGLLQDSTGLPSLLYYTALLLLGSLMRKKVILKANGVGPLTRPISRSLVSAALKKASVTVRDEASQALLKKLGVKAALAPDTALSLVPADEERIARLLEKHGLAKESYAIVAPKDEEGAVFSVPMELTPVLIPFFPSQDLSFCLKWKERLPHAVLMEGLTPDEILGVIGHASLVLGMRLHALIFADRMGVPRRAVGQNPKVTGYARP